MDLLKLNTHTRITLKIINIFVRIIESYISFFVVKSWLTNAWASCLWHFDYTKFIVIFLSAERRWVDFPSSVFPLSYNNSHHKLRWLLCLWVMVNVRQFACGFLIWYMGFRSFPATVRFVWSTTSKENHVKVLLFLVFLSFYGYALPRLLFFNKIISCYQVGRKRGLFWMFEVQLMGFRCWMAVIEIYCFFCFFFLKGSSHVLWIGYWRFRWKMDISFIQNWSGKILLNATY